MRFLSISVLLFLLSIISFAQVHEIELNRKSSAKKSISQSTSGVRFSFSQDKIYYKIKTTKDGDSFSDIWLSSSYPNGEVGKPNLPAYKKLIRIPKGSTPTVIVASHSEQLIVLKEKGINHPIYPNQPSVSKSQDTANIKFEIRRSEYSKSSYSNNPIATIEVLGNLRSATIARLVVNPIDYNPADGIIKVYNDIDVDVTFEGALSSDLEQEFDAKTYSPYFDATYKSLEQFSKSSYTNHPDLTKYPVRMIIVCPDSFKTVIKPFIQWKVSKGFTIDTLYKTTETSNQIKSFIQQKYYESTPENPAPSFLVLVGDVELVPASETGTETGRKTDLYYASIDGDMFPEMYYGRLSVINKKQLTNIINKIIYYEKYQFTDPSYLNKVTLIAGVDGTGWTSKVGIPTIKYSTANYFNSLNGFTTINEFGVSSDPNNPSSIAGYTNCYNPDRIGVSFVNYTAHGSETNWVDPFLGNATIGTFSNINKYPLVIGNCCVTGDFGYPECFGEAWIRAKDKGAIAYIGSSPNSFWYEDFYWSVGAFPIAGSNDGYVPSFQETTIGAYDAPFVSDYVSLGGIVFAGNLAVTEVNIQGFNKTQASSDKYYWEGYNILGDPSLIPFFTEANPNQVSYQPTIVVGETSFIVSALAGSYIAISKEGRLLGVAQTIADGEAIVPIAPITSTGEVSIVITRPQTIPVITTIQAINPTGPFLMLDSYIINDQLENDNGKADYNESFSTNIKIKNIGIEDATNVKVKILGLDANIFINSNDSISVANIPHGVGLNFINVASAFSFKVQENFPDQYVASFILKFYSDQGSWTSRLSILLNAPLLVIGKIKIDDTILGGNADSTLNSGETCNALVQIINKGHAVAHDISFEVSIPDSLLGIASVSNILTAPFSLEANSIFILPFRISVIPNLHQEPIIPIKLQAQVIEPAGLSKLFENSLQVIVKETVNMSNATVNTCFSYFFDSGGKDGNYTNSENHSMTFDALDDNKFLKVSFREFSTEKDYDFLYIYDGPNTSSPQVLGSPFSGSILPKDIFLSSQYVTFKFTSDDNTIKKGWKATVECIDPQIPACVNNPNPADGEELVQTSTLKWDSQTFASFYDIYTGSSPSSLVFSERVFKPEYNFMPEKNRNYYWRVVPGNFVGTNVSNCSIWKFTTDTISQIFMSNNTFKVDSILFYDSGGPLLNYKNNETTTLTLNPNRTGNKVRVSFITFDIESQADCNFDNLTVYDGSNTISPIIGKYCGTDSIGIVEATNIEGSLTFVFKSDDNITLSGWKAVVRSIGSTDVPKITSSHTKFYPNPVTDLLSILSEKPIKRISVLNTLGIVVKIQVGSGSNQETISLGKLTPGLYILIINSENSIPEKALIIKK